jgi:hypothetical protein
MRSILLSLCLLIRVLYINFYIFYWGKISSESYCAHTVPVIHGYIELMKKQGIRLEERGIEVIFWPPYSPDLNPIEKVWHIMKNYLQDHFPENMTYDKLRMAVKKAWEKVGRFEFEALINIMPVRCQAVIDANGMFTKYQTICIYSLYTIYFYHEMLRFLKWLGISPRKGSHASVHTTL